MVDVDAASADVVKGTDPGSNGVGRDTNPDEGRKEAHQGKKEALPAWVAEMMAIKTTEGAGRPNAEMAKEQHESAEHGE